MLACRGSSGELGGCVDGGVRLPCRQCGGQLNAPASPRRADQKRSKYSQALSIPSALAGHETDRRTRYWAPNGLVWKSLERVAGCLSRKPLLPDGRRVDGTEPWPGNASLDGVRERASSLLRADVPDASSPARLSGWGRLRGVWPVPPRFPSRYPRVHDRSTFTRYCRSCRGTRMAAGMHWVAVAATVCPIAYEAIASVSR